jgi:mRNA-degrading endonuclease RelE of RelBE toxin-antitoxin system
MASFLTLCIQWNLQSSSLKKELNTLKKSGLYPDFQKKVQEVLTQNPLCGVALKEELQGLYRIKLRKDWRIVYAIDTYQKIVIIKSVAPRSDIYSSPSELSKR